MRNGDAEAGTGGVLVVILALVISAGALGAARFGVAVEAAARADTAADVSALAAAQALATGAPGATACEMARSVAAANGADVRACRTADGGYVEVRVQLRGAYPARATAAAEARGQ